MGTRRDPVTSVFPSLAALAGLLATAAALAPACSRDDSKLRKAEPSAAPSASPGTLPPTATPSPSPSPTPTPTPTVGPTATKSPAPEGPDLGTVTLIGAPTTPLALSVGADFHCQPDNAPAKPVGTVFLRGQTANLGAGTYHWQLAACGVEGLLREFTPTLGTTVNPPPAGALKLSGSPQVSYAIVKFEGAMMPVGLVVIDGKPCRYLNGSTCAEPGARLQVESGYYLRKPEGGSDQEFEIVREDKVKVRGTWRTLTLP